MIFSSFLFYESNSVLFDSLEPLFDYTREREKNQARFRLGTENSVKKWAKG